MTSSSSPKAIAIVGGGRWARIIAKIAQEVVSPQARLICSSPSNPASWESWKQNHPRWENNLSIADIAQDTSVSHVIIARKAKDHAATTLELVNDERRILTEKPFCLTLSELTELVSSTHSGSLRTGHVFDYATNLSLFRTACLDAGAIQSVSVNWEDPTGETRHGEAKTYDPSLNLIQDVFPHVWTIIKSYASNNPLELLSVRGKNGGRATRLELSSGNVSLSAELKREAKQRLRQITVHGENFVAELDFSEEPGSAKLNGRAIEIQRSFSSPLAAELASFFDNTMTESCMVQNAAECIRLSVAAVAEVRGYQKELLGSWVRQNEIEQNTRDIAYALREIELGGINADGKSSAENDIADWLGVPVETLTKFMMQAKSSSKESRENQ